jgi:selenocysteine lyase/cysteine desulfurase
MHGLEASLKLLTETGVAAIQSYLEVLTDHLCDRLKGSDYEVISSRRGGEKSQIVCIRHIGSLTPMDLFVHLKQQSIMTAPRGQGLRIAPHFYNNHEDIDRLVEALP